MTFHELTRMMLNSMDFFELRRTASRYAVPYQGVRRQKLIRDIERKILLKGAIRPTSEAGVPDTIAAQSPEGAVLARPNFSNESKKSASSGITTFSARSALPRAQSVK